VKLGFAFRLYFQNLRASKNLNLFSVGIISFAFFILGLFLLLAKNLDQIVERWGEKVQVVVFLKDGVSEKEIKALEKKLTQKPEVAQINYVSKKEALERLKKMLGARSSVLAGLEKNPLPASFEIQLKRKARSLEQIQALAEEIKKLNPVEEVSYGQKWLKNFLSLVTDFSCQRVHHL